ncbi:hypothetical protein, conserved [Babesia bigemina]|uniref:Uncharacterized protein n=1 Tax=Babesia bigemina TaxID=5866 RepID=A0A061BJB8_BABBI|nr:hypothetical protein, conserved [Babesia bigemina]CDR71571.1 hypothetical protein, conserved [Babesia bigemina]|eukprot:XP_012770517.1 hypothetical protein, conserved [Babesia bigemina]
MRGLGAAVVEGSGRGSGSVAVEGSGSGSGSVAVGECVARLRGLGAAVVEGSGSGSGSVAVANSYLKRLRKQCNPNVCKAGKTDCTNIYKCECNCCRQKCKERDPVCTPLAPPPPPPPADSSDVQDHAAGQELLPRTEALEQENNSPPFRPNPQTIAAVIVAIIVAIILLDLCIFRFPVGRNIRDFLVRKIPFCIAFYS